MKTKKGKKIKLPTTNFEELLLEAIDEALSSLGESSKTATYINLEKKFNIPKQTIPIQIEDFSGALNKLFGLGAKYIEILCMKNLNRKLQSLRIDDTFDWLTSEFTFALFVKIKKNQFEKSVHNLEMGIPYDEKQQ